MKVIIILLTTLVVGGAIVWLIDRLFYHKNVGKNVDETGGNAADEGATQQGCADESCGLRSICPSEQLLAGECRQEVIYYDDEELDAFNGRDEDDYSQEELEQWRDVLYTLQPDDLLGWGQSIRRRGLTMPAAIKDEFLLLASEHRGNQTIK